MHPVVNHQKEKKRNTKVTSNNAGNNGTVVASRPVNTAYDLTIPSTDGNRNNRDSAAVTHKQCKVTSCYRAQQAEAGEKF